MTAALISKPLVEPLTLASAKAHLRIDGTDEDVFISELIIAARQYLEKLSGLRLITQTWRQYLDCWPKSQILVLAFRPVQSVQSITVYDVDGAPSIITAGEYQLDNISDSARIHMPNPVAPGMAMNGIEVDYIAGYGDIGVDVPDTLKRALLMLIAHWYEFRGAIAPGDQPISIPPGFEALIHPFKRMTI